MGAFVELIILTFVVGLFAYAICEILDSRLADISESLSFLADHVHHSCDKCQDESEKGDETDQDSEKL